MENRDTNHPSAKHHPRALVCLYAQRDEPWYRELQKYLVVWQKQGRIYWADQASVQQADLVLLLLSPDFFATNGCLTAMESAFEVRSERGVAVVPVLARTSPWKESVCGALKALPDNDRPIVEWRQKERAYENICTGLARLLPDLPALGIAPPEGLRLFQARDLPKGYVARSNEFAAAKQLLLHRPGTQAAVITTALRGAGGFGKTTLALALCHDGEIQAAFPDGILWVELGEHPPRPHDVLNGLLASLEPSRTEAVTLEEAKKRWRSALQDRVCLLVIDDVWRAEALLPLLKGGPACVRLVTTRNDLLLPPDATRVLVDAMELYEAIAVLCQGLPEAIHQAASQPNLASLAARLGCWPLLLTLANGLLTELVGAHLSFTEALATIGEAYQTRGVTAFRLDNVEERQGTVEACLKVSLEHLETFTHAHYQATERYQELAVFPDDTDIPLATLQTYWKGAGLEPWEAKDLCVRLYRLSLLLTCDLGGGTIRLHDVLRSYLIQRAGADLPALHSRLLDACQQKYGVTRWANLPRNEVYLWQHLIFHFCQARHQEVLQTTLIDLSYLTRKALYVGVVALEYDLILANTAPSPKIAEPVSSFLVSLHRSIVRISHLIRQAQTEAEMGGLLLSYLGWEPAFTALWISLECELPHPFLIARHPLPNRSSSALQRTLHGHTDQVNDCAVSPNGKWIVSASDDETLKVWDAATGVQRLTLSGHTGSVNACAFSPDGKWIVSASADHTLKIWDAITGSERLTLESHIEAVNGCAVSPDGSFIVSASKDKTLKVWDAITGSERLNLKGHTKWGFNDCVVSPDGRWIVSVSHKRPHKVWDTATGTERLTLGLTKEEFNACAVSPDGSFIVAASNSGALKVWDAATGTEQLTLEGHISLAYGCAVSPDGSFIVSASADHTLKIWDAITGSERLTLTGHTDSVNACAVSPDGSVIVSASQDKTLKIWDAAMEGERFSSSGHTDSVNACAVSPDGNFIVSASEDQTLKIWDAVTGSERFTLEGHTSGVHGCAVSPDGSFIVSASWDGTLKIWDAATGSERLTLEGHIDSVEGCAFSPDGRFIVSASDDQTLKIWDVATGSERLTLEGHTWLLSCCVVSPDGKFIVSASWDGTLKIWDAATGEGRLTLRGHSDHVNGCALSADGRLVVSASRDQTLKVWETHSGRCLLTFPVDGALYGCAFHPDGEHLVACGAHGVYFLRLVM